MTSSLYNSFQFIPKKILLGELYIDFTVAEFNSVSGSGEADEFLGNLCSMRVKLNESTYFIASSLLIRLIRFQLMLCDLFEILWKFKPSFDILVVLNTRILLLVSMPVIAVLKCLLKCVSPG